MFRQSTGTVLPLCAAEAMGFALPGLTFALCTVPNSEWGFFQPVCRVGTRLDCEARHKLGCRIAAKSPASCCKASSLPTQSTEQQQQQQPKQQQETYRKAPGQLLQRDNSDMHAQPFSVVTYYRGMTAGCQYRTKSSLAASILSNT